MDNSSCRMDNSLHRMDNNLFKQDNNLFKMDNNLYKHNFLNPTSFKPSLVLKIKTSLASKLSSCPKLSLCLKISLDPNPSLYLKTSSANSSSFPLSPAMPWVTLPTPSSQHLQEEERSARQACMDRQSDNNYYAKNNGIHK